MLHVHVSAIRQYKTVFVSSSKTWFFPCCFFIFCFSSTFKFNVNIMDSGNDHIGVDDGSNNLPMERLVNDTVRVLDF